MIFPMPIIIPPTHGEPMSRQGAILFLVSLPILIPFVLGLLEASLIGEKPKPFNSIAKLMFFTFGIGLIIGNVIFKPFGEPK